MASDRNTNLEILRLQAGLFALESLCIALFKTSLGPEAALRQFEQYKEHVLASMIGDGNLSDEAFEAFDAAHSRILGLLSEQARST